MRRIAFLLFTALLSLPLCAQENQEPTAPIPPLITGAKTVFISNGGADALAMEQFDPAGQPDEPYPSFYNAMRTWGRYQLVLDPNAADLIFEVRVTRVVDMPERPALRAAQLSITIVDPKSHVTLWTVCAPVQDAILKSTWRKNFAAGVANAIERLKKIAGPTSGKATEVQ